MCGWGAGRHAHRRSRSIEVGGPGEAYRQELERIGSMDKGSESRSIAFLKQLFICIFPATARVGLSPTIDGSGQHLQPAPLTVMHCDPQRVWPVNMCPKPSLFGCALAKFGKEVRLKGC